MLYSFAVEASMKIVRIEFEIDHKYCTSREKDNNAEKAIEYVGDMANDRAKGWREIISVHK